MSLFNQNQTYYSLLEIPNDAAQHEVTEAYRRAKATYSPDSPALYTMFSPEEAAELLKLIEEAYITLSNRISRNKYDEQLSGSSNSVSKEEYPDFSLDNHNTATSDTNKKSTSHMDRANINNSPLQQVKEVPDGFAKTKFGIYEINDEIETKIQSNEISFDGSFLQEVRQYKSINLEQMSLETKISRPYLVAIESNEYEALPARVFVRGFIIQICKILNLDGKKISASYLEILKSHES